MKVPFRPIRNFSRSNSGAVWPHKYFLKGTFYLERFRTRLVRLSRLLNNFYFTHNGSNTFTLACCSSFVVTPTKRSQLRSNLKAPL